MVDYPRRSHHCLPINTLFYNTLSSAWAVVDVSPARVIVPCSLSSRSFTRVFSPLLFAWCCRRYEFPDDWWFLLVTCTISLWCLFFYSRSPFPILSLNPNLNSRWCTQTPRKCLSRVVAFAPINHQRSLLQPFQRKGGRWFVLGYTLSNGV